MPYATLDNIRQMVRFLTKSPSQALLTDAMIDQWVNVFLLYDFPEHLRLFELHSTFSWYCQPNIDTYLTDKTIPVNDPLYNFQNTYITVNPPIYVAGYQASYSQSREQFYRMWPQVGSITQVNAGNGATLAYTGTVTAGSNPGSPGAPILRNYVLFSSVDVNGMGLQKIDQPILDAVTGQQTNYGRLIVPTPTPPPPLSLTAPYTTDINFPSTDFINYLTTQYAVSFATAPAVGVPINAQVYQYVPSRPLSLLWYDNKFIVRPVPDQPYQITMEVYKRPTELIVSTQEPTMEQHWQYIAYGTARKILQLRFDYDSVQLIEPEFRKQQELVLNRTVVQNTTQRVATIYSQQSDLGGGWGNWNGYGQSGI